mmetsp:Transcript_11971/g.28593  ORF Transcript_11971/g.28593 Transcript_11971/m.28593 type:complete len:961 (-) Transcript_11971:198-3080(-)
MSGLSPNASASQARAAFMSQSPPSFSPIRDPEESGSDSESRTRCAEKNEETGGDSVRQRLFQDLSSPNERGLSAASTNAMMVDATQDVNMLEQHSEPKDEEAEETEQEHGEDPEDQQESEEESEEAEEAEEAEAEALPSAAKDMELETAETQEPQEPQEAQQDKATEEAEAEEGEEEALEDDPPEKEAEVADADNQGHQIVAADGGIAEQWSGTLPPEASAKWEVSDEVCSLHFSTSDIKLPRSVYDRLYHYQRQGVVWMWNLYHKGFGGILADEMGLGKTVQTAAFLACLKFTNQGSRFLVVVPVTLLEQWRRELDAWAQNTGLAVHVMHGALPERRAALRGHVSSGGVLLVSYDLARTCIHQLRTAGLTEASASQSRKRKRSTRRACRDDDSPSEEDATPLGPVDDEQKPWDVLVVDEGHQIKNPSSQSGRVLRRINARSRILLTGTPLQNKLSDLWALMDFAQPALLGNHATFERNFSEQIAKGSKRNASRFAVELKDHLARELKRLTAPHFLRRLKCEVANTTSPAASLDAAPGELPPKMDVILWLNLTSAQLELYNLFLTSELVCKARGGTKCGMEALRAIAMLKKLCGHPLLCLPQDEYNQWRAETLQSGHQAPAAAAAPVSNQTATQEEPAGTQEAPECLELLPRLRALMPNSVQGAALLSTKLRVLSVLLPQLQRRGHRCLIFSQSVRMLDLIQGCVLRVLGLKFLRIDGSIDPKDRDVKLQKFQQEDSRYFALCLSMQVGGTGLTVTGANRVILVDPAWNPSADAQAIDRVHRIGQKREVVVYRLIGSGAIEDKMFRLQIFKGGLSKTFMEHEQQVRFFTHQQLKSLFEPPSQSASTQSLLAEQIGTEALEHEDLLRVVAADVGSTDDPQALAFWQSSDVLGFSDYQRLFMFLEQADSEEQEAVEQAKELAAKLKSEEYVKDQVVQGKWRGDRFAAKENVSPQVSEPLKNA